MAIITIDGLVALAQQAIADYQASGGVAGKDSGYLTVLHVPTGNLWFTAQIGQCPSDKAEKYMCFSIEKACRLHTNPSHQLSSESRNPDKDCWGGAVKAGNLILSFSGLPEEADESLVIWISARVGLITGNEAEVLAGLSAILH